MDDVTLFLTRTPNKKIEPSSLIGTIARGTTQIRRKIIPSHSNPLMQGIHRPHRASARSSQNSDAENSIPSTCDFPPAVALCAASDATYCCTIIVIITIRRNFMPLWIFIISVPVDMSRGEVLFYAHFITAIRSCQIHCV